MTDLVKRLRSIDQMSVEDCFLQSYLYTKAAERIDAQALANPMVQALLSYAGHRRRCSLMSAFVEGKACTCGYDAALAAMEADDE